MDILQAKRAKWWIVTGSSLVFCGFVAAVTWGKIARADDVAALAQRVATTELDITDVKKHKREDDKLTDWLVKAMWSLHPNVAPPPSRSDP